MTGRRARILRARFVRTLIVLGGIVAGQVILNGPSLAGHKILLPLDILAQQSVYLPVAPEFPHDYTQSDLVELGEPARQFAIAEFRAGRLPMWNPYEYAGSPVTAPKFSPFFLVSCSTASPVILPWTQLLAAVVAGSGIYVFLRRTMRVCYWAAAIPAWCYPLTGFFIFWQGFGTSWAVCWLPWLLLAVDGTIRGVRKAAPILLSIVTALVLVSGELDVAGQVLLVSGMFGVWRIVDRYRREWLGRRARRAVAVLTIGWTLGFLLAAPYILPLAEYARTGARMEHRAQGREERPPVGAAALPQAVFPDMYGSFARGSMRIVSGNQSESSCAAYAGLFATLFAAPLAWYGRRHRAMNLFWVLLGFFGLSWCLNVPVLVTLLRLPGLNMMSHNRLVFATSLAVLALASAGLDAAWRGTIRGGRWILLPVACLAALTGWCGYRVENPPEEIATGLGSLIAQHKTFLWIRDFQDVQQVQRWFAHAYLISMLLCGLALTGWMLVWWRPRWPGWAIPALGILMAADLLWFAHGRTAQCDPALYYPRIPALEKIAESEPGRVIGIHCLPAALAQTHGLRDIRGYDAVDPGRLMDLMSLAAAPEYQAVPYALTQWFQPSGEITPGGIRLSPVLDMLDVRYAILRGKPPAGLTPFCESDDYWVMRNPNALDRVYVPRRVAAADGADEMQKLASPQFNARDVAYVEAPVNLPNSANGEVKIVSEIPTRVTLSIHMATAGLVVLADLWDTGWHAYLNGRPADILRVNHAIRGVMAPAGDGVLEFRYEPASFRLGVELAGAAAAALAAWFASTV